MYRTRVTGPLARRRHPGLPRPDRPQVKLRGNRIERGAIESVLTAHQNAAQAVVVCTEPSGGESPAGHLVAAEGRRVGTARLRPLPAGCPTTWCPWARRGDRTRDTAPTVPSALSGRRPSGGDQAHRARPSRSVVDGPAGGRAAAGEAAAAPSRAACGGGGHRGRQAGPRRTGSAVWPLLIRVGNGRSSSTGTASRAAGNRAKNRRRAVATSRRASGAPRQKCTP